LVVVPAIERVLAMADSSGFRSSQYHNKSSIARWRFHATKVAARHSVATPRVADCGARQLAVSILVKRIKGVG
jgi:hypothetical protein